MTKAELIERLMESNDIETKAQATRILDHLKGIVIEQLAAGNEVAMGQDFGTFKPVTRAARTGRVPGTGAQVQVPASNTVKFRIAPALKRELNK